MIEDYNKNNNTDFDFYEVVRGNYNTFLNSGVMTVLTATTYTKAYWRSI